MLKTLDWLYSYYGRPVVSSFFLLSFFFFLLLSLPNLSRRTLDVYRTSTPGVA